MEISQYDIVVVNLDPTIGSEIKKTRPCVVISPDEMNRHLRTVIIAPITSTSKDYPTRVLIQIRGNSNWIVVDQIRTIDKQRVHKKAGKLRKTEVEILKSVIKETLVD
jgi:mRNA interferase MazF